MRLLSSFDRRLQLGPADHFVSGERERVLVGAQVGVLGNEIDAGRDRQLLARNGRRPDRRVGQPQQQIPPIGGDHYGRSRLPAGRMDPFTHFARDPGPRFGIQPAGDAGQRLWRVGREAPGVQRELLRKRLDFRIGGDRGLPGITG